MLAKSIFVLLLIAHGKLEFFLKKKGKKVLKELKFFKGDCAPHTTFASVQCQNQLCNIDCEFGFAKNNDGCDTCQ
jgi:hypothetical protein